MVQVNNWYVCIGYFISVLQSQNINQAQCVSLLRRIYLNMNWMCDVLFTQLLLFLPKIMTWEKCIVIQPLSIHSFKARFLFCVFSQFEGLCSVIQYMLRMHFSYSRAKVHHAFQLLQKKKQFCQLVFSPVSLSIAEGKCV